MSSLRTFLVNSSLAFACTLVLLHSAVFAVTPGSSTKKAEQGTLKIGDKAVSRVDRGVCNNSEHNVEIVLSDGLWNNIKEFRVLRKIGKAGAQSSSCPTTVKDGQEDFNFSESERKFAQGELLGPTQCNSKKGENGFFYLCVYPGKSYKEDELVASVKYNFSTKVTRITGFDEIMPFNNMVGFRVDYDGDAAEVETCYGEKATCMPPKNTEDCPTTCTSQTDPAPYVTIKGLINKTEYVFQARLISTAGTVSSWSDQPFNSTPRSTALPGSVYDGKGGWNCQTSEPGSAIFLTVVLLMLLLMRMRHRLQLKKASSSLFFIALVAFLPTKDAQAEFGQVNIGILGSPYWPDLDSEKHDSGENIFPFYHCFYRRKLSDTSGPINPLMGAEFDLHLLDGFGSLQLGLGLGYTYVNGLGVEHDDKGFPDCNRRIPNVDIKLHMYQIRPQITYHFSPFADNFPLYPYIRGALIVHGYVFTMGSKLAPSETHPLDDNVANRPSGLRFGYQAAAGLMLRINFLEPEAVASARSHDMFENIYLKGELSYIDFFGKGFQFSPKDIMGTPYPLMWTFGLVFELP